MIGLEDVRAASARIAGAVHRTPVLTSRTLDETTGARVFVKAENQQRGGAFKLRGATNRVEGRSDAEREQGVFAVSSGNHAQAVAHRRSPRRTAGDDPDAGGRARRRSSPRRAATAPRWCSTTATDRRTATSSRATSPPSAA